MVRDPVLAPGLPVCLLWFLHVEVKSCRLSIAKVSRAHMFAYYNNFLWISFAKKHCLLEKRRGTLGDQGAISMGESILAGLQLVSGRLGMHSRYCQEVRLRGTVRGAVERYG